jgi:hypothetical protein
MERVGLGPVRGGMCDAATVDGAVGLANTARRMEAGTVQVVDTDSF